MYTYCIHLTTSDTSGFNNFRFYIYYTIIKTKIPNLWVIMIFFLGMNLNHSLHLKYIQKNSLYFSIVDHTNIDDFPFLPRLFFSMLV